jgi:hypothetical protein
MQSGTHQLATSFEGSVRLIGCTRCSKIFTMDISIEKCNSLKTTFWVVSKAQSAIILAIGKSIINTYYLFPSSLYSTDRKRNIRRARVSRVRGIINGTRNLAIFFNCPRLLLLVLVVVMMSR